MQRHWEADYIVSIHGSPVLHFLISDCHGDQESGFFKSIGQLSEGLALLIFSCRQVMGQKYKMAVSKQKDEVPMKTTT